MLKNAITLFVFTVIILILFISPYSKMQDLKQKNQEYSVRIKQLEKKNAQLLAERERLKNDPEYLEKVARERMGLIREGEKVYKAVPEAKKKKQ